jgi:hypothetical protein
MKARTSEAVPGRRIPHASYPAFATIQNGELAIIIPFPHKRIMADLQLNEDEVRQIVTMVKSFMREAEPSLENYCLSYGG